MGLLLESKLSQLFDEQLNKSINLFDSMTKLMQTKEFEKKAENDTQTSLSKLSDTYNMKTKKIINQEMKTTELVIKDGQYFEVRTFLPKLPASDAAMVENNPLGLHVQRTRVFFTNLIGQALRARF